jgi:hypothetical protein
VLPPRIVSGPRTVRFSLFASAVTAGTCWVPVGYTRSPGAKGSVSHTACCLHMPQTRQPPCPDQIHRRLLRTLDVPGSALPSDHSRSAIDSAFSLSCVDGKVLTRHGVATFSTEGHFPIAYALRFDYAACDRRLKRRSVWCVRHQPLTVCFGLASLTLLPSRLDACSAAAHCIVRVAFIVLLVRFFAFNVHTFFALLRAGVQTASHRVCRVLCCY